MVNNQCRGRDFQIEVPKGTPPPPRSPPRATDTREIETVRPIFPPQIYSGEGYTVTNSKYVSASTNSMTAKQIKL